VNIGDRVFVGANASIKQGITIGDDVTIGMGAAVIQDVGSGAKIVGVPAKRNLN